MQRLSLLFPVVFGLMNICRNVKEIGRKGCLLVNAQDLETGELGFIPKSAIESRGKLLNLRCFSLPMCRMGVMILRSSSQECNIEPLFANSKGSAETTLVRTKELSVNEIHKNALESPVTAGVFKGSALCYTIIICFECICNSSQQVRCFTQGYGQSVAVTDVGGH